MKNSNLTIVMYHYVRDLQNSRYPEIKGLDLPLFKEQVLFLKKHYQSVTMEQVIDATEGKTSLPERAVLLTFDDAYLDHYINVFPILANEKIQGSFFAPVRAVTEHKVLDVNKIHFILASSLDKTKLVKKSFDLMDRYRENYGLESNEHYYKELAHASRLDTAEVIFLKRLLQVALPEELRNIMVDALFTEFVGVAEEAFSRELYMNQDQMQHMVANGMHFGSHGFDHYWLNSLDEEQQWQELSKSVNFLDEIGADPNFRSICYPYGGYNETTLLLAKKLNFKVGFSTQVAVANLRDENPLALSRLDTNDLPKDQHAEPNQWYAKG